jgi:hypothetical protein
MSVDRSNLHGEYAGKMDLGVRVKVGGLGLQG